jgi:heat shock protein HtpX
MAAYGLYSHIQSNRRRSAALLAGLFFLVYLLVYAGALIAEALSVNADLDTLMRRALSDLISAAPLATIGTVLWIVIAYFFHQNMIDAMTGGQESRAGRSRGSTIFWKISASRAASPCPSSR